MCAARRGGGVVGRIHIVVSRCSHQIGGGVLIGHHAGDATFFSAVLWAVAIGLSGCSGEDPSEVQPLPGRGAAPETAWVEIGAQLFELELALDPEARYRGLGGRRFISPTGGMLFVNEGSQAVAMVMRDCPIPIDVAFLDEEGRIVANHEMRPEPPRGPTETARHYESRLPVYRSGIPARFSLETAGGRLAEAGVGVGDLLIFDTRAVLERAAAAASRQGRLIVPDG